MTVGRFTLEINREIDSKIIKPMNRIIGSAGINGYRAAKDYTPIDTGFLAANWRLTKNKASISSPGKGRHPIGHIKGNDIYSSKSSQSTSSARRVASTFDVMKHKYLYLSNNVNYSSIINSKHHMLARSLQVMKVTLNKLVTV